MPIPREKPEDECLLEVKNLTTRFDTEEGLVHAVNDVSYCLDEGETLGVVGESGCGKSVHALSIMRLIPIPPGRIEKGEVLLSGDNLLEKSEEEMRFVFESGSDPDEPYVIDASVVGDLFRVSDLMFMPSHREGFAMPVLEAGLDGIPVVCTKVPAAVEIGGEDVILFDLDEEPNCLGARILAWAEGSAGHRLRRRVRQGYTWQAIFSRDIEPLLRRREDA